MNTNALQPQAGRAGRWDRVADRIPVGAIVALFALLGIALGWMALLQQIERQESEVISAAAVSNINLAHAFNEHVLRIVRDVDLQSRILAAEVGREGLGRVDLEVFHRTISAAMPFVIRIGAIDASGYLVTSSWPVERLFIGDREHVRALRDSDPGSLFIGRPVTSRSTGAWWIPMTRRLNTPSGEFAGVLMFAVDPEYFSRFYGTVSLGNQGVITLYRNDGIVLARHPDLIQSIGRNASSLPDARIFLAQVAGFRVTQGAFDGIPRVIAFSSLADYPLKVVVGTSLKEVLAPVHGRKPAFFLVAAMLTAVMLAASFAIALLYRARKRSVEALQNSRREILSLNEELERRVAERTAELETAVREMETFTYTVAHDLRSPLRAMNGYASILLERFGERARGEDRRYLERVAGNAQRMGRLIDDLLAYAYYSHQPMRKRDVDVGELARSVLAERIPGDGGVQANVGELPPCHADPALLRSVLDHLVSNAVKFSGAAAPPIVDIGYAGDAYFVRDNGIGFDMAYADKLFKPFTRMHRLEEYAGTGMGLAIVRRIVERHGGRVWAHAGAGAGATFYFRMGPEIPASSSPG